MLHINCHVESVSVAYCWQSRNVIFRCAVDGGVLNARRPSVRFGLVRLSTKFEIQALHLDKAATLFSPLSHSERERGEQCITFHTTSDRPDCILLCSIRKCRLFRSFHKIRFPMYKRNGKMYLNFMWAASNIDAIPHTPYGAAHRCSMVVVGFMSVSRHQTRFTPTFTSMCLRFSTHSMYLS